MLDFLGDGGLACLQAGGQGGDAAHHGAIPGADDQAAGGAWHGGKGVGEYVRLNVRRNSSITHVSVPLNVPLLCVVMVLYNDRETTICL